jgi:L-amino acid N-acyltransferase YncA/aromatic ring-cleaving dioxygenase
MNHSVSIRPSLEGDVAAIAAIYRHHVLHGVASFEEVAPEPEEIARRRHKIVSHDLPYLVAERAGRVLGYCYASLYRPRSAYRFTVEDSVYVDAAEVGRGIGRALLSELIERCTGQGYRQMIAVIGGGHQWPSIGLHRALGFSWIGVFPAIGFKFGDWVDTVLMQRALGAGATTSPEGAGVSMGDAFDQPARIEGYHAHIYYDPATRAKAERLRAGIGARFEARLGSWHDEPVGPHPVSMYQVAFTAEAFAHLVPWLMLNRDGLDVLVHPMSGDSLADHTRFAMWLGQTLPLRLEVLWRTTDAG